MTAVRTLYLVGTSDWWSGAQKMGGGKGAGAQIGGKRGKRKMLRTSKMFFSNGGKGLKKQKDLPKIVVLKRGR